MKLLKFRIVTALMGCFFALGLGLGNFRPAALGPEPAAAAEPERRLEAGDQIRLDVLGRPDITGVYAVNSSGAVQLPLVGSVPIAGKTLVQITDELSRRFSLADRDIQRVSVTIADSAKFRIFVLGGVLRPGSYTFSTSPTAWEAIAEAGGSIPSADLSRVRLIPGDGAPDRLAQTVDLAAALRSGRVDEVQRLRSGDTVRVPVVGTDLDLSSDQVQVFGAVNAQGSKSITLAPDLVAAVANSGGFAVDANPSQIQIVRRIGDRVVTMKVNLKDYMKQGTAAGNPALQPGDAVFVPHSGGGGFRSALGILSAISPVIAIVSAVAAFSR